MTSTRNQMQRESRATVVEVGGGPSHGTRWPLLLVMAFAMSACEHAPPAPPVQEIAPAEAPALGSVRLYPDSGHPLEPLFVTPLSPGSFVGVDRGTRELWKFSYSGGVAMHDLSALDLSTRDQVLGLGVGPRGVGVLDNRGRLTIVDTATGTAIDTIQIEAQRSRRVVGLHGLVDGTWAVLAEQASVDRATGTMLDSLLLFRIFVDGHADALWRHQKIGGESIAALVSDYVSFSGSGDSLRIAASDPPRIWEFVVDRDTVARLIAELDGAPQRSISQQEQDAVRRLTRGAAVSMIKVPTVYPPLARAWTVDSGFAVMAGSGASTFALDEYCGTTFNRTVLQGPDVVDIAWLPQVVVVRRQGTDAEYFRLDLYSPAQLTPVCAST